MYSMSFVRGVGIGIMVGGAIGAACARQRKHPKGTVGRALKNLGSLMEDVTDTIMK